MSLSGLLVAVVDVVSDSIVNDAAQPAPDRIFAYHGKAAPDDCCTDPGVLTVSWAEGRPSSSFPKPSVLETDQCAVLPIVTITARYMTCWHVPEADQSGVTVSDAQDLGWNDAALTLADVSLAVSGALIRLTCAAQSAATEDTDPIVAAVLSNVGRRGWLRYVDATPIVPSGGCAGLQWRLYAAPTAGP